MPLGMLAAAVLILMALTAISALLGVGAPARPEGLNTSLLSGDLSRVARVAGFTFWQAALSALLSLLVALPMAVSFLRRILTSRLQILNSLL